jgi:hypothetical protein
MGFVPEITATNQHHLEGAPCLTLLL